MPQTGQSQVMINEYDMPQLCQQILNLVLFSTIYSKPQKDSWSWCWGNFLTKNVQLEKQTGNLE